MQSNEFVLSHSPDVAVFACNQRNQLSMANYYLIVKSLELCTKLYLYAIGVYRDSN